jgi:hypothetical protein
MRSDKAVRGDFYIKVGRLQYKVRTALKDKDLKGLKDKDTKRQKTIKTDSPVGVRMSF